MSKHDEGWEMVVRGLMATGHEERAIRLEEALWDRGAREISIWATEREVEFLEKDAKRLSIAAELARELLEQERKDKREGTRGADLELV